MSNQQQAFLFDTNFYRTFVSGKSAETVVKDIKTLKQLEAAKNIKAIAVTVTALELVGSLVEGEEGFNYSECYGGIIAMAHHCTDDQDVGPNIIPPPFLLLAKSFFDMEPADFILKVKSIGGVINDFYKDPEEAVSGHKKSGTFESVKTWLNVQEEEFVDLVLKMVNDVRQYVKQKHPSADAKKLRSEELKFVKTEGYEAILAYSILVGTAQNLNVSLPNDEFQFRANELVKEVPVAVGFFKWVVKEIIEKNIDMHSKKSRKKRWNWVWDYQVSIVISHTTLNGLKSYLVTSDEGIAELLAELGLANRVMNAADYLSFVGFNKI